MDKNKNLYKLDDFFLIISYLLLLPLIYIFWPMIKYAISNPEGIQEILLQFVRSQSVLVTILVGSIIFLQILGRLIRKEEKILVKILDIVVMYKTISINQLQHNLDMNQPQIERYIKKLSNIGRLNIHFDGTYVKLELNTSTDAIHRVSPTPSNTISSKEDLQNILIKLQGSSQGKQTSGKKFNVVLFIILFFVFWPFAFIYAASYYMKSQKGKVIEDRLKNRLKDM